MPFQRRFTRKQFLAKFAWQFYFLITESTCRRKCSLRLNALLQPAQSHKYILICSASMLNFINMFFTVERLKIEKKINLVIWQSLIDCEHSRFTKKNSSTSWWHELKFTVTYRLHIMQFECHISYCFI